VGARKTNERPNERGEHKSQRVGLMLFVHVRIRGPFTPESEMGCRVVPSPIAVLVLHRSGSAKSAEPPAAMTLFQSTSYKRLPSVMIAQFLLNSSWFAKPEA
jgi:hypothetical protein